MAAVLASGQGWSQIGDLALEVRGPRPVEELALKLDGVDGVLEVSTSDSAD